MGSSCSCRYSWDVIKCRLINAAHRRRKKETCRCVMRRPKCLRRRRKQNYECTCSRRYCIVHPPPQSPTPDHTRCECCKTICGPSPEPPKSPCINIRTIACGPPTFRESRTPSPCFSTKVPIRKKSSSPSISPSSPTPARSPCGLPKCSSFRSEACGPDTPSGSPRVSPQTCPLSQARSNVCCGPDSPIPAPCSPVIEPPCKRSRNQSPLVPKIISRSATPSPSRGESNSGSIVAHQSCFCENSDRPKNVCRFTIDAYFT